MLVVDDDADFRESIQRLLWVISESLPTRVREAGCGDEAMSVLKKEPVNCMLLDNRMPGETGIEWIRRFLDENANLAIIMVTGQGDERTAVQAMKNGAADYLIKGAISADSLECAIMNAVEKVRMRQALLIAEQHRVMIESLGSACHHLGQPMAVITMCLEMMKRKEWDSKVQALMDLCDGAVEAVNDILGRLQNVSAYRTEAYLSGPEGETTRWDKRILKI